MYVIINPILGIDTNLEIEEFTNSIIENETIETSSESDIANTYILSLQSSIKTQIESLRIYSWKCSN